LSEDKEVKIDIYNTTGQLVRASIYEANGKQGISNNTISVDDIPPGVYNMKIYLGQDLHTKRLILLKN